MTESAHDTPEAESTALDWRARMEADSPMMHMGAPTGPDDIPETQWGRLHPEPELTPRELAALQAMLAQILAELMAKHKAVKRGEALAQFTKVGQREVPDLDGTALGTVTLEAGASATWTVTDPDDLLAWVQANDTHSLATETTTTYDVGAGFRRMVVRAAKDDAEVASMETGEIFRARDIPGIGMGQPAAPKLVIRPDWDAAVPAVLAALGDAAVLLGLEAPELEAAEASARAELAGMEGQ